MKPTISGIKCRTCGVRNFLEAESCKRCNASFEQYEEKNLYMYQKSEGIIPPEPVPPQHQFTRMQAKDFKTIGYVAAALLGFYLVFAFLPAMIKPKPGKTTTANAESSGYYLDYPFTFRKERERVVAVFYPKILPRDDAALIGATKSVIQKAFGESVSSDPVLVGIEIKFKNASHSFMVMPIKEDTGEIHSLVIERR